MTGECSSRPDRRKRLGTFDTVNEAEAAVITKRLELFTHNDLDRLRDTKITPQGAEAIARLIAKASAA